MFDNGWVLSYAEVTVLQRSAAMASLAKADQLALAEAMLELLTERRRIVELLAQLPEPVGHLRSALNAIAAILASPTG